MTQLTLRAHNYYFRPLKKLIRICEHTRTIWTYEPGQNIELRACETARFKQSERNFRRTREILLVKTKNTKKTNLCMSSSTYLLWTLRWGSRYTGQCDPWFHQANWCETPKYWCVAYTVHCTVSHNDQDQHISTPISIMKSKDTQKCIIPIGVFRVRV